MDILLYDNKSENNVISKTINLLETLTGNLRGESNVVSPSILIEHDSPLTCNYVYIPQFLRYYYITEITSVRNGLWKLSLKSDSLMSFKNSILSARAIIEETKETKKDLYLPARSFVTKVKDKTEIKNFPSGLLDTGEWILITAGG